MKGLKNYKRILQEQKGNVGHWDGIILIFNPIQGQNYEEIS